MYGKETHLALKAAHRIEVDGLHSQLAAREGDLARSREAGTRVALENNQLVNQLGQLTDDRVRMKDTIAALKGTVDELEHQIDQAEEKAAWSEYWESQVDRLSEKVATAQTSAAVMAALLR